MRLADFIRSDMENILAEWQVFAANQLPAATNMDALELRNHAEAILNAVATDISQHQTPDEEQAKAKGEAPKSTGSETAAETHGVLRSRSGFNVNQMVAEFRALRASVLRRWAASLGKVALDVQDVIRFNEAIDQAIAESISQFAADGAVTEFLFGMLGRYAKPPERDQDVG